MTGLKSGSYCETNLHFDDSQKQNLSSAPGLTMNCSSKSKTRSNVSFNFYPVNLQASTSVSGQSVEEPLIKQV